MRPLSRRDQTLRAALLASMGAVSLAVGGLVVLYGLVPLL